MADGMSRAEAFAREWEVRNQAAMGFHEPEPDDARIPPLPHMPAPPRAPLQEAEDEPDPHPPWPESPLVELGRQGVAPEPAPDPQMLMVVGGQATYLGQAALLTETEQAAVGRIVLEAAQRVIRERLEAVRKLAPRRKARAKAQPAAAAAAAAEAPKKRRGRPPKAKPIEEAQYA